MLENSFDIYHTNGISSAINHLSCSTARRLRKPYIIAPYGMLHDYRPGNRVTLTRRIYHRIFLNHDLQKATCLRAISEEEAYNIRRLGFNNPIAYIPWPNNVPSFLDEAIKEGNEWKKQNPDRRRVATIIVEDEYSDLESIIKAFKKVAKKNDELLLLDFGYSPSTANIKRMVQEQNLGNVRVADSDDYRNSVLLASSCATVIPSHHQFMGPVIARSLLCLTPAICLHHPEWEEVPPMDCGWWCSPLPQSLENQISTALMMDYELLAEKGRNGRKLILDKYSTEVVSNQMIQLYKWLLGEGPKPSYII